MKKLKDFLKSNWVFLIIASISFISMFLWVVPIISFGLLIWIMATKRLVSKDLGKKFSDYEKLVSDYNLLSDKYEQDKIKYQNKIESEFRDKRYNLTEEYAKLKVECKHELMEEEIKVKKELKELEEGKKLSIKQINDEIDFERDKLRIMKESLSDVELKHRDIVLPYTYVKEDSDGLKYHRDILKEHIKDMGDFNSLLYGLKGDDKREFRMQLRQLQRMFNMECEMAYSKLRLSNFDSIQNRIINSYKSINKLFEVDGIQLTEQALDRKLLLLKIHHDIIMKLNEESELRRQERERLKEEQKIEKELEKIQLKIEKEESHFKSEIKKLKSKQKFIVDGDELQNYLNKIKELEMKLFEVEESKKDITKRIENTRAGYVYVISNVGSFGEDVYKIGMTRRLEPLDRVKELGDASVPFPFDVHALIFSEDAPKLESILHQHFNDYQLNKVNTRKEFFKINIDEIEKVVKENYNNTVHFIKEPEAEQYKESLKL